MRVPVLFGCLLVLGVEAAEKRTKKIRPPPPVPTTVSEKLAKAMGGQVAQMLLAATQFQIARTSHTQGIRPLADRAIGSDFQRQSEWKELAQAQIQKLQAIVYDEKAFRLSANVSGCNFVPEVVFQLTGHTLDSQQILVSFRCNQVLFFTVKTGGRAVPGMALDFKPARKKMLALVQELLPEDAELRSLR